MKRNGKVKNKFSKKMINKKQFQIQNSSDLTEVINPFKDMSREQIKKSSGCIIFRC